MHNHIPLNIPLPQCQGPKLQPFCKGKPQIDFLRRLSATDEAIHSHVFEVLIDGQVYALKLFKFYSDREAQDSLTPGELSVISISDLRAQTDPFYNECRAYGRLMESGVNGKVAVRCYGHLHLAADLEQDLAKKFQVHDWHRPEEEYSLPVTRRQPFRAIVKELIRKDTPLSEKLIRKMLRDLIKMRALGVYPLDVYERNYKGGLLLDMSVAVTEPHFELVFRGPIHTRALQRKDLMRFQRIIDDSGVRTWQRSLRNRQYCMKLRNCPNGHEKRPKWHVMSITPIDPKWRGLDGSDVDTHVQISRKPKPPKSRRR